MCLWVNIAGNFGRETGTSLLITSSYARDFILCLLPKRHLLRLILRNSKYAFQANDTPPVTEAAWPVGENQIPLVQCWPLIELH